MESLLTELSSSRPELAEELEALEAIYGENSISPGDLLGDGPDQDVPMDLLVTLPDEYPSTRPPQLQLASKYVGSFTVTPQLFGSIIRLYMSEGKWTEGQPAIFEGVEECKELVTNWYNELASEKIALDMQRQEEKAQQQQSNANSNSNSPQQSIVSSPSSLSAQQENPKRNSNIQIVSSDPIIDRKSVFVGHCALLKSPNDVEDILDILKQDKKIARATHNIWAYTFKFDNGPLQNANDDDGESAAGQRLSHLLQLLHVENVMVVVSRWYGGIHLGPDRFKHINQAARNSLVRGGFVPDNSNNNTSKSKSKPKK